MKNPVSIMSATPEYGIGVAKNRFALVDIEDEDPLELLKRKEIEKEERKKAKLAEKENKSKHITPVTKPKTQKVLKETQKTKALSEIQKPKDDKKIRKDVDAGDKGFHNPDNREYSREQKWGEEDGLNERNDRNNRNSYSADGFQRGRGSGRRFQRGIFVRGGGGGRGGPRGGGGGGGAGRTSFDNRGKREYDRQSGSDKTGVKPIDKRDGSGAHNWGNPQDDWTNQNNDDWQKEQQEEWNNQQDDWDSSAPQQNDEKPVVDVEGGIENGSTEQTDNLNESAENAKDDEKKVLNEEEAAEKAEMTLDEWKAKKMPRQQPKYNIRKPGEGEDLTQWKKMYALEKKRESDDSDEDYEFDMELYPQRVGRQRRLLDIDIKFKDNRGGERGRGRGFGRGSRGSFAQSRNNAEHRDRDSTPAPRVDDEKDFPSLV